MYAIYKGFEYSAEKLACENEITLHSSVQREGFEAYVSEISGRTFKNHFIKKVNMNELDYLFSIRYEIQYRGQFYTYMNGVFKKSIIDKDEYYIVSDDLNKLEYLQYIGFDYGDKFYLQRKIQRSDIEAIKIIEEPEGIFKDQGLKIKIIEGKDIDDFLASIKD